MSRLTLADLQHDLERKQGGALEAVVIELLARGKSGRRVLAVALCEGPRGETLQAGLRARAGQAVELLTRLADFDTDPDGLCLLSTLAPAELGRKALEIWDRGERQLALRLAGLVEGRGGHYLATLVLARRLRSEGLIREALVKYEEASTLGAPPAELWNELGAALEEAGRLAQAMDLYRQSYPARPEVAGAMARLLVRVLSGRGRQPATRCCQVLLELAAEDPAAAARILEQAVAHLRENAYRELEAVERYWHELAGWVHRLHRIYAAWPGAGEPPVETAGELAAVAGGASEYATLLHRHLLMWQELTPTPREAAGLWSKLPETEAVRVQVEPGLPRVAVDPVQFDLGLASLLTWTHRYRPGPWQLVACPQEDGVLFSASYREGGREEPVEDLPWHTAAVMLARHGGELAVTGQGWVAWLPAAAPRIMTPLATQLAELFTASRPRQEWLEEVAVHCRALGTETAGALGLAAALAMAREQLARRLVAGNTGAVTVVCLRLALELEEAREAWAITSRPVPSLAGQDRRFAVMEMLLESARGYLALAAEPVMAYHDPAAAVRPALDSLLPLLTRYGVQLAVAIAPALPRIRVDPARLALLARELVVGMALGMPGGGSVQVTMTQAAGTLHFEAEGRAFGVTTVTGPEAREAGPGPLAEGSLLTVTRVARDHHATVEVSGAPGEGRVTVSLPAEAGERRLASALPELARLGGETRRALLAAEGLAVQPQHDDLVVGFLLGKALELELRPRLLPRLERHLLLPGATAGAASGRGEALARILETTWDRALQGRCQALEAAIIKGRQAREWADLRNLGVAVAAFTPASGREEPIAWPGVDPVLLRELAAALFRCGEVMSRTKAGRPLAEPAHRLLALLARLPEAGE